MSIREILISEEGYKLSVYKDIFGNYTVGVGHLILDSDNIPRVEGHTISSDMVEFLFNSDLAIAIRGIEHLLTEDVYSVLCGSKKCALLNMIFNLGYSHMSHFRLMLSAIRIGDHVTAGKEILNSLAAHQLPGRYHRIFNMYMKET